jgi:predicted O-linked N-acetylglucosamine transferase (SPINDLY family)
MGEPDLMALGLEHHRAGRLDEAAAAYREFLRLRPGHGRALALLGLATLQRGDGAEAARLAELAVSADPRDPGCYNVLADARHALGDLAGAVEAYTRALALDEARVDAWWGLGCAQQGLNHQADAADSLRRAVALAPDHGQARHNLGRALSEIGLIDEALEEFRQVLRRHGPNPLTLGALATLVPGSPRADHQTVLEERRRWAALFAPPGPARTFDHLRDAGRRPLRVGYVSSFFHHRNWMKPVWGLINHHDRERFAVHLFSDAPEAAIEHGYRKDGRDRFHDIAGMANAAVADQIAAEGIDLLVDLNAYSQLSRLPLFPLRPAPVVVSWFNSYAASGLDCFHALVGDEHVIRPEEERYYSEPVVRLPGCYLTFEVGYTVPDVVPPPCLARGFFTFGCLAPQYKITPEVVAAWAQILHDSPGSRLVLKNRLLATADTRKFVHAQFARLGVGPERLELEGPAEHYAFLKKYDDVDVSLDTFPYNGGTTTAESLWQGVPVLTFDGDRWASRISASMQRFAGLAEFVAADAGGYVRQAVELANDPGTPARLAPLRATLRERLRQSSLCDVRGFARLVEGLYVRLWERWCGGGCG